jgi:hypothetical protein
MKVENDITMNRIPDDANKAPLPAGGKPRNHGASVHVGGSSAFWAASSSWLADPHYPVPNGYLWCRLFIGGSVLAQVEVSRDLSRRTGIVFESQQQ